MKSLHEQVVLLTGAAGGFGRSLSRLLLAEGCRLVLADRRRVDLAAAAEALARTAHGTPGRLLGFVAADLAEPAGAETLWAQTQRISPQIDILVNNAGMAVYGRFDQIPTGQWEALMQLNLLTPIHLTALALPQMLARRSGHIVNISSCAGLVGTAGFGAYSASKFGLRGFSEALGADVAPYGVDVTAIYPWFARTSILHAEQYGDRPRRKVPAILVDDPHMVMVALVNGIKQRRRHIYPGPKAGLINGLRRYAPGLLQLLA